ncbi:MAG: SpoIID/LytB domain-containing protein [Candidatus Gottesmanbacteria bacterium]|nr:SpoIID/LytB domain-containing protein [Candidatus Gottesmanbacteria bacterium]
MNTYSRFFFHPLIYLFSYFIISLFVYSPVWAQSCDPSCGNPNECRDKIAKCQEAWNQMETAKKPHVDALRKMESDIAAFQGRIKLLEVDLVKKGAAIAAGEKEIGGLLELATRRARQLYIRVQSTNPLVTFLGSSNIGAVLRSLAYQMAVLDKDKKSITRTAISVKGLEEKKKTLEVEAASLAYLKQETDKRAVSVRTLVGEASAYQGKLTSIIGSLTAKQQSFLAQKLSGLGLPTSLGAGPLYCTDDRKLDPGFRPGFAFFTFGIPHRVGMNQYGAYGRAKDGHNYDRILRAYFNFDDYQDKGSISIKVNNGRGINQGSVIWTGSLEEYVKRIYEVPASWPAEVLKAQAIAARSYVLYSTDNGNNSVCATQDCQVFKTDPKGGEWEKAVNDTSGKVMVQGGQVVAAWFSSTDGGYTFQNNDVWGGSQKSWTKRMRDANGDVGSFSDLLSKGYDRDSPCFYAAQGFRSEYAKSAWLKEEEVADVVNVILLARKDGGTKEHLYQPDKPNPAGTDSWNRDKVRQELSSRGVTPFTSVSDIRVSGVNWGEGRVTQVMVSGNGGSASFDGPEFKDFFNLRAPANIQIVGPLFNVERK